ncbi:Retrovirus-related Pol polyprotein from transposon RE1 [Vitis vinifera]|uniref:Retrovirus-related Pol polyprotein from transposon RE1 n=1 Tax=Vitis vinifera TaxID=29760 RepID=A0A438EN44_VITVI|nr:Retrovirus-related Pol polyprotein from transposon RE1 [Vitis vinifera]
MGIYSTQPEPYSFKEKAIPEQKQVQESNSDLGNEITVRSDPPLHTQPGETSTDSTDNLDLDLPIAVRKGTRECTNQSLYPLSHYVSLKHLSPIHKNLLRLLLQLQNEYYEEIYMNIPPGFEENTGNKVCKLKKALYELKQSPRAWFGRFAKVMKESGYKQSQGDHTLFIKHSATRGVTVLLVYVDDIIVTGNDERGKHEVKQRLATKFEIKELGKLKYFLSIEVAYSTQGIFISQQKYVIDLWQKQERLGVLHYLKGNPEEGILFKKNNTLALEACTDADYAGSLVDRRFNYRIILDDLRIKWDGPMKFYCDNKSAINIAHNPIQHDRIKHIEIDRHSIKEKLEEGVVCMSYVPSEHQLDDILTKGLNNSMFHDLVFKLGMEDIYSSA